MSDFSECLNRLYYDLKHPASFGSIKTLFEFAKREHPSIKLKDVKEWLSGQISYTLHRPARKNFIRNKIYVNHINEQFQADLVDMQEFSRQNKGYKYILTVIDCLSKYLWAFPLKSKTATTVIESFRKIFRERKPLKIQTDRGKEFDNAQFKSFCRSVDVKYFTSKDAKIKCSIVERVNRTLKEKMFRYFTARGTRNYIDILDNLVESYNKRWHTSIRMKPIDVNESNERLVFRNLYGARNLKEIYLKNQTERNQLNAGATVRKKYDLSKFDRGYYPNWTDQTFKVFKSLEKVGKPQYIIEDYEGSKSARRYYREELQPVSSETAYRVERVIRKRVRNKILEYFVKWMNYPPSQNSWIQAKDLFKLHEKR
jgi:transposase InsO family protein